MLPMPIWGWNTSTFAGLFPRVFFGFSCGILIHRAMQPTFTKRLPPALARVLQNPLLPALLLICTLAMPLRLHGAYSLFSIALLAPSLVVLGATASSRNIAINKASEFLGWISFPVYCLHRPVLSAVRDMADGSAAPWSRVISPEVTAMVLTIMISILLTRLIDRLQVQRRLVRRWQGALPQ
jgi:peptidoglycan/LPS O-acetylase OafA/YrhL